MDVPHNTTIAVVDGEHFKTYRNAAQAPAITLEELPQLSSEDRNSASGRHSSSGNPAEKQMEEDAFNKGVSEKLNRMVLDGRVDHLVIIAAPRALGEMRRNYHAKLSEVLIGEIDKVMTHASLAELEETLKHA